MGATIHIILIGIVLLSSSWSVECASLVRQFRSARDVEFPFIHNASDSTVSIPTSTTLLQENIKESNITTVKPSRNKEQISKINLHEHKLESTTDVSKLPVIKHDDNKENKSASTETEPSKETLILQNFEPSKVKLRVDQVSTDSAKVPSVKPLNVSIAPKVQEGISKPLTLDRSIAVTDKSNVPEGTSQSLDLSKEVPLKDVLKGESKDELTKADLKELINVSQGSARSLNFDIDKYTSPDFHNKNNVYTLPTSPEIEKYIEPETHDFATEVTKRPLQNRYFSSTPIKFNTDLTTPHTFFDSKFQNIAEGIKQNLEDIEGTQSQKYDDNLEKYDVPTLIENVKNADNETKVSLETKEFKNIQVKSEDLKGLKDENQGSNVDYTSTYLRTRNYDDVSVKDTTVANTILDISKSKDSQISPSVSIESTTKSSTSAPTKKSRRQSLRNNTIETAPVLKPKHFKLFASTTPYDLDLIRETERMSTKSNGNNITKRGSTKYVEATTKSSEFHMDIDGKNFSIPPTATAWTLAGLREVPSTAGYKYLKDVSSTPETEQNLQENQLVKVELLPTIIVDSTTEISTDSSSSPSTEYSSTKFVKLSELSSTLNLKSNSTTSMSTSLSSPTEQPPELRSIEVPSSSEQSYTNTITKDDISLSYTLQTNTSVQSTPSTGISTDGTNYSENVTTENNTTGDTEDISSTENIINETTELTELRTDSNTELHPEFNSTLRIELSTEPSTEFSTEMATQTSTNINSELSTDTNYSTTEADEKMMSDSTDIYEDMSSASTTEGSIDSTTNTKNTDGSTSSGSWTTEQYTFSPSHLDITSDLTDEGITKWDAPTDETTSKIEQTTEGNNEYSTVEEFKKISTKTESENELYTTINTSMNYTTQKPDTQSTSEIDSVYTFMEVSTLQPIEEETVVVDNGAMPDKKIETKANPVDNGTTTTKQTVSITTEGDNSSDMTSSTEQLADDDEDGNNNTGMIAAIAISTVGGICLIILVGLLLIMRKRQKRVTYGQRCRPVSLDAYSLDNVSVYNSVRRKGALRASKRSYGNPAFDDPVSISHQMNFQTLAKFAETPEEITTEFEEIPQVNARANEVPAGCETKNRYANVIPLPETRVFLIASDNDPHSDYINANYVTGPKNTRGYYIACQAPMQNTVDDFWRMIWEQQCRVVLMLTNLYENGVEKCVDYLPPSEVLDCHRLFGDFQITLKKREVKEKYIISNLQLKNMVSNSWREVTHLWYLGWPERGVPTEANSLIAFLIEARSHLKAASNNNDKQNNETTNINISGVSGADGGPLVVHCSPGTGRTGTVIACDIAIRDFELTRAVDIPKIVYRVRRDRASAVQTREQYAFIYKLIALYATKLTGGALDSI